MDSPDPRRWQALAVLGVAYLMVVPGGALGLAILTTVSTTRTNNLLTTGVPRPTALTDGFRLAFWASAGIDLITVLVLFRHEESRLGAEPAELHADEAADQRVAG